MTTATHQNENGKGKEIQRPRTPERQLQEKMGKKPRPDYLKRRFYEGKWYCDCENWTLPAHYRSITNVFNENYGKPFWACSDPVKRCGFFVWIHEEENEKRRLAEYEPYIIPPTPRSLDTPWTLSKKRKTVSRETSDQQGEENTMDDSDPVQSTQRLFREATPTGEDMASPSRKKARTNHATTSGALPSNSHELAASSLPSPQSSNPNIGDAQASRTQAQTANRLESAIVLDEERALTTRIIELLSEDGIKLKASTRIMLDYEIDIVVDKHEIETRRFRETNSAMRWKMDELMEEVDRLKGKVTEMENKIELWTGVGAEDDDNGLYGD